MKTAKQAAAPRNERVQPYTTPTASATNALARVNTDSMCAFQAVGTTCSRFWNRYSPMACTYR